MKGIGIKILIIVVAVVFVLGVAKDMIAKVAVEKGVEFATGLPLKIQGFAIGVLEPRVSITGMTLHNPGNFKDKVMVEIPEIYVDYNPMAFLQHKKVHLREARLNLAQVTVIKNESGETNINALKTAKKAPAKKPAEPGEKKKAASMPDIQIDSLTLKIGKVVFKDYSKDPNNPSVREFDVGIDEEFHNITNVNALVGLIVSRALSKTAIGRLANVDVGVFSDAASGAVTAAKDTAVKAGAVVTDATKETLQKTTEGIKGLFKAQ